jgi:hypothetical protein
LPRVAAAITKGTRRLEGGGGGGSEAVRQADRRRTDRRWAMRRRIRIEDEGNGTRDTR